MLFIAGCATEVIDVERVTRAATLGVRATGCGPRTGFGTAAMIDDDVALTAAHVVAGADDVAVIDVMGSEHPATVVWFDPDQDLAALRVDAGIAEPLPLYDGVVDAGVTGLVGLERDIDTERQVMIGAVEVLRRANVSTTDIYLDAAVIRPGFEIAGSIEPGDSGSVVVIEGAAAGVIWARSTERAGRAWVVNIPDVLRDPVLLDEFIDSVDSGACTR